MHAFQPCLSGSKQTHCNVLHFTLQNASLSIFLINLTCRSALLATLLATLGVAMCGLRGVVCEMWLRGVVAVELLDRGCAAGALVGVACVDESSETGGLCVLFAIVPCVGHRREREREPDAAHWVKCMSTHICTSTMLTSYMRAHSTQNTHAHTNTRTPAVVRSQRQPDWNQSPHPHASVGLTPRWAGQGVKQL